MTQKRGVRFCPTVGVEGAGLCVKDGPAFYLQLPSRALLSQSSGKRASLALSFGRSREVRLTARFNYKQELQSASLKSSTRALDVIGSQVHGLLVLHVIPQETNQTFNQAR